MMKLSGCLIFCQVSGGVAVPMLVIVTDSTRTIYVNRYEAVVTKYRILERLINPRALGYVPLSLIATGEVFRSIRSFNFGS